MNALCRIGLHDWRAIGLMSNWGGYVEYCARCGKKVRRG